jgi:hypothetical protein
MAHQTTMTPEALESFEGTVFLNKFESRRQKKLRDKIVKMETSEKAFEEHWEVSGLGTFALVPEGRPVPYDSPVQGNKARIWHQKYGLGYRVTEEMQKDDRWDVVRRMAEDLVDSAEDHMERLAHQPWNNAFSNSVFSTLDTVALVSTSHTSLNGGGTRSNRLASDADLAPESVEAMLTLASLLKDDQGRFIPFEPKRLLTHTNQRWEAERIFESQYRPGSADNDINVLESNRIGVTPVYSPYLDDTDAWFLFDPETFMVLWYTRQDLTPSRGTDFDTGDMKTKMTYRAGLGCPKFEGVFGTSGN